MLDTVNEIKSQYARILENGDWVNFKEIAEFYFMAAAKLKKKHIESKKNILLLRNSQKRLFLGIGCELFLKAIYLKNGYCINKLKSGSNKNNSPIHKLSSLNIETINSNDTFSIGPLIDKLDKVFEIDKFDKVKRGLQIAMTFRNKEGHVTFPSHEFNDSNYKDISDAIILLYHQFFNENLIFNISMKPNEKYEFRLSMQQ